MALGMFCAIPLPFFIWDERLMVTTVASFPLIGLIVGGIWWGAFLLFSAFDLPLMIMSAILTVVPFLVAGFIHLDGFMDTSDAHLSRRPLEDRLRILKDPAVGAFAVVMLVILFLLQFAAVYTIMEGGRFLALVIAICVISRCCSAMSIFVLKHMPVSNYSSMLGGRVGAGPKVFVCLTALGGTALAVMYEGPAGLIAAAAVVLGYGAAMRVVYKSFEGVSGDLLGYAMVIGELCGLIALALVQNVL